MSTATIWQTVVSVLAVIVVIATTATASAAPPHEGRILWLDAGDIDADGKPDPTEQNRVREWRDKSRAGNHVRQDDPKLQPRVVTGAFGDRPGIRFGTTSLSREHLSGFQPGEQHFQIFLVFRATLQESGNPRILDLPTRGTDVKRTKNYTLKRKGFWLGYQDFQGAKGHLRIGIHVGDEGQARDVSWDGAAHLVEATYAGNQRWALYQDGKPIGRGRFAGDNTFLGFDGGAKLALGQRFGSKEASTWFRGDVAEVMVYRRTLNVTEQAAVGDYLAKKYGLETHYASLRRAQPPQFEADILPLLSARCDSCHSGDSPKGSLRLGSLRALLQGGTSGPAIERGNANGSLLFHMIATNEMPPKKPLSPEEVQQVRHWIDGGAAAVEEVTFMDSHATAGSGHWAFQKLRDPGVPCVPDIAVVSDTDRVRTPIDAFILQKLASHGLRLSRRANRNTLLRRAYLDLLGLLPPPQDQLELESTESNPDTDVGWWEALLDRLLSSPHLGERWGRHWLDGAGYSDTLGLDNDQAIIKEGPGKWQYRDYVVASFNNDKPLAQFLTEQIAGDELIPWRETKQLGATERQKLIATGFLRCSPDFTDENELNTLGVRYGVLHRTAESLAHQLLGLTMQCCKCHDHKFEPLPQRDYYRFVAVLAPALNPKNWLQPAARQLSGFGTPIQAVYDVGSPSTVYVLRRGSHEAPGAAVEPGLFGVIAPTGTDALPHLASSTALKASSGRRRALAGQLTDWTSRAGALVARVRVNRVWQQLFGVGLVPSSDNFGVSGTPPTHPELLEWLTVYYVRHGARLKPLLKLILSSEVYQQSAAIHAPADRRVVAARRVDPDNRLLWRQRLRRLEAEIVRDAVLCASGRLDPTIGGAPVKIENRPDGSVVEASAAKVTADKRWRRSLYVLQRRNYHLSMLAAFDQPVFTRGCTQRDASAVVSQALTMLNDPFVGRQAELMAQEVSREQPGASPAGLIRAMFRRVLARSPTPDELRWSELTLRRHVATYRKTGIDASAALERALVQIGHMLLNTSEFLYVH